MSRRRGNPAASRLASSGWRGLAAAMTLWSLTAIGCGASQPTVIEGNRYVTSGELSAAQVQCSDSLPSRQWAVVIGINFYDDERIPDLSGAVNDAWSFYHYLASPQGAAIDPFRLRLLLNEEATKQGVEDALGEFLEYACPQDEIMIYFAGHGAPEPDRPEEAFLLVNDTNLDSMVSSAISMSRLPDFLSWRTGNTGRLLMLIDACHSGNIQFPGAKDSGTRGFVMKRSESVVTSVSELVQGKPGWGAISATAPDQLAGEAAASCVIGGKEYSGGIFTCYLLEGLAGGADKDRDNQVTLGEAFDHLKERVSEARGGEQVPQKSGQLEDDLVLSNTRNLTIDIPQVPEKYLVEDDGGALVPFIWVGAGLTAAALGAGLIFNLQANADADRLDDFNNIDMTKADYQSIEDSRDQNITLATASYAAGAALAVATASLLSWELLSEPEGIDDAYEKPPWFQLSVNPAAQGSGASLNLELELD